MLYFYFQTIACMITPIKNDVHQFDQSRARSFLRRRYTRRPTHTHIYTLSEQMAVQSESTVQLCNLPTIYIQSLRSHGFLSPATDCNIFFSQKYRFHFMWSSKANLKDFVLSVKIIIATLLETQAYLFIFICAYSS